MKRVDELLIVALVAVMSGCHIPMSNEEIITEVNRCQSAGLLPELFRDISSRIVYVGCIPPPAREPGERQ